MTASSHDRGTAEADRIAAVQGPKDECCPECRREVPTWDAESCNTCRKRMASEQAKQHRKWLDRTYPSRLKSARLPRSLSSIDMPENAPAEVSAWANGEIQGLCLTGTVGIGKTYLAAAACRLRLRLGPVRWVRVAQLMTQLRASFGDVAKEEAQAVIAGVGAVVLDDLDKVNPSEFGREVLFCAIDGRVQEGAPLLVTTNLPLSEIGQRLGEPVASRLAGYCEIIRMTGEDKRLS